MKIQIKKSLTSMLAIIVLSFFFATTAWSALSILDSQKIQNSNITTKSFNIDSTTTEKKSARAPEPTSLALLGGSVIGMLINFVRKTYSVGKRIFDIIVGSLAVVLLSPLFLLAAILIKFTSPGPIFFTQERVGKDGKIFKILKFRTMKVDAERESGPVWAAANDSRLIPAGKFLRKTHIDEIPQFINVLRGEMSVVGPRPERPIFVEKFKAIIPEYEKRLLVKPGITGMAQVWHKYDETVDDVRKKIKYDLLYIKKICLWTDLRIFFRTFRVVLTGEGAH